MNLEQPKSLKPLQITTAIMHYKWQAPEGKIFKTE